MPQKYVGSSVGSSADFLGFLGYFWHFSREGKKLGSLDFQGSQRLGEKIRTSGLLNPIQETIVDFQGFQGSLSVVGR
jgi:hypothetical protein